MVTNAVKDLRVRPFPELSWTNEDRMSSLEKTTQYVSSEAQNAINWYLDKKQTKKAWAQRLRFLAIVATTTAGLIPLLAEISASGGKPVISPAWASVALVLAVAFVGLDRFFGFSTAWMRFLITEIKIRNALQEFYIDWEIQRSILKDQNPTDQQLQEMLDRCKVFLHKVNTLLENEMNMWAEEFRTAIREIDEAAKARAEVTKIGAANIMITNGDQCEGGWEFSIDNGAAVHHFGKSAAVRDLIPGPHTIIVKSEIGNKQVQGSAAFTVAGGAVAQVKIGLE